MNVRRVHDDAGSHIEPECQPHWSDLRKLQWHAAVAMLTVPFEIKVLEFPENFNLIISNGHGRMSSMSVGTFDRCWAIITGLIIAEEMR